MIGLRRLPGRALASARRRRGDVVGVGLLVVLALLFLSPALKDGLSFGGFDFDTGRLSSLGSGLYRVVHSVANGDAVSQMVSWNALSWHLVHNAQFPLFNEYSVLGMPQFLNFESSVLSLPDLLSYAAPAPAAFLVVVAAKLVLAGTGTYAFGRVVGLSPFGACFSGVTFMFAGAFANWLTWPLTDVACFAGWICCFAVCCYRRPAARHVSGLALAVAFSVYGGFPEANVMLALTLGLAGAVTLLLLALTRRHLSPLGTAAVGTGCVLGTGLSAPLWLPGLQIIDLAHRHFDGRYVGLPTRTLALVLTQGYYGLATGPASTFGLPRWNYYETVSYLGVVAVALAVVGVVAWRRRPLVVGLVAAVALSLLATYEPRPFHPFQSLVDAEGGLLSAVRFERMRVVTAFLIAVLAGIGADALRRRWGDRLVRRGYFATVALLAAVVAYLVADSLSAHLSPTLHHERLASLVWPVALVAVLAASGATLSMARRRRGGGAARLASAGIGLMFAGNAAFLFFSGVGVPSYSRLYYGTTPAIATLQRLVGSGLLGLDGGNAGNVRAFGHVGFYPNVNIGYGVRLFAVHDPLVPAEYFTSWPVPSAAPVEFGVGLFVPDIDTAALARRYGIGFVLAGPHLPPPPGMRRLAVLADETLYAVPRSAQFTFLPRSGRVLSSTSNGDGSYALSVVTTRPARLRLGVTALPGWNVTIDGRRAALGTVSGVMESVEVPAGRHLVHLWYWPERLGIGVALAAAAALALAVLGVVEAIGGRLRRVRPPDPEPPDAAGGADALRLV